MRDKCNIKIFLQLSIKGKVPVQRIVTNTVTNIFQGSVGDLGGLEDLQVSGYKVYNGCLGCSFITLLVDISDTVL